ncbi:hypothetical protein A2U01_0101893, partial [Trifolium medium]|nr:hypothetical protein [Trifolium medium]
FGFVSSLSGSRRGWFRGGGRFARSDLFRHFFVVHGTGFNCFIKTVVSSVSRFYGGGWVLDGVVLFSIGSFIS